MSNPYKPDDQVEVIGGMSKKIDGLRGRVMYVDGEFCEVELEGRKDYDRVHYSALSYQVTEDQSPYFSFGEYYTTTDEINPKVYKPDQVHVSDPVLPTDAKERKETPIYSGVLQYFPLALAEIARLSKAGNDQHNPDKPLHWDRSKSGDELDALTRHLMEAGTIDTDGQRHSAKVAWRALANLQKELEGE